MIKLIKAIYKNRLLDKKFVNGVGIGYKIKDGEITDKKCIIVTVTEKIKKDFLKESDLVPKKLLGLFQTDVVEVGDLQAMWRDKHRPVKMGSSCSWEGLTACSTGLPIWDRNGNPYLMMNGHCVWADGKAKVGDRVLQPAPADGGTKDDKIGEVTDMNAKREGNDAIDLSVVKLTEEVLQEDVAGHTYTPKTRYLKQSDLLKKVKGGGRTIGERREGVITSIDFTAQVRNNNGDVVRYEDCVLSLNADPDGDAIVKGGDSSSIRFVDNMPLVQTFAGSAVAAIFNQTQKSLDYAEAIWDKKFSLKKPEEPIEGYLVLHREYLTGDETLVNLNIRKKPEIGDNIIKTLPKGTKLNIISYEGYKDDYHWVKVKTI